MIRRLELLMWLAANDDEHTDAFADLIGDGLLLVQNEGDAVTGYQNRRGAA